MHMSPRRLLAELVDPRMIEPRRRVRARGVTLVEVLIVVAILSLIAGGVAIFAIPRFQEAQKKQATTDTKNLSSVVQAYRVDHPSDCPTLEQLRTEKLLPGDQSLNDPWGSQYKIVCGEGSDYGVMSPGPDKKEGTEDDVWAGTRPK